MNAHPPLNTGGLDGGLPPTFVQGVNAGLPILDNQMTIGDPIISTATSGPVDAPEEPNQNPFSNVEMDFLMQLIMQSSGIPPVPPSNGSEGDQMPSLPSVGGFQPSPSGSRSRSLTCETPSDKQMTTREVVHQQMRVAQSKERRASSQNPLRSIKEIVDVSFEEAWSQSKRQAAVSEEVVRIGYPPNPRLNRQIDNRLSYLRRTRQLMLQQVVQAGDNPEKLHEQPAQTQQSAVAQELLAAAVQQQFMTFGQNTSSE